MVTETEKALRWKSRRGWLELDLTLQNFWQLHSGKISPDDLNTLRDWLTLDDPQLWALLQDESRAKNKLALKIINGDKPHG